MRDSKKFPGKVLLFGEYTLLFEQRSFAIPFHKYKGQWREAANPSGQAGLNPWAVYIDSLSKNQHWLPSTIALKFIQDVEAGLWFDSDIPQGYGLGSSGALVAAWYDRYISPSAEVPLLELKNRMALLESFFHGTSSGFDPLVSYLQTSVMMDQGNIHTIPSLGQLPLINDCFLLDTGHPRSTEPLVNIFKQKTKIPIFKNEILPELIKAQSNAMNAFILGEAQTLKDEFYKISNIQFNHLSELIPDYLKELWLAGLNEKEFLLKLCGAGGGGCMLGLGKKPTTAFNLYNLTD